ncbi:TonB-dependent receptor plug domain-containing protein, partial [Megasphaera cerevisiae]
DAMGRVGVSIRGAEPRHTLILVDGQAVMGDFAKYYGAGDELLRQGTENVERIEIIQGAASAKYGSDAIGGVINIITRKPAKTAGMEVNVEGRRVKGDSDVFPYQNVFLRADSGQMGKVRATIFGSKRDVLPIYDNSGMTLLPPSIMTTDLGNYKNSLRYYGTISNVGLAAEYDVNDHNTISFNANHYKEDLKKDTKHTNMWMEPYQQFKRTADRNTYGLSWKGNNQGSTDWNVELNYARMNEDDIALTSDYQKSIYEGKNTLNYVDDIDHRQYDFKASANTQVNDRHLLTYGVTYTYEKGEGSRLKGAPDTAQQAIDPWNYDKSLSIDQKTGQPGSSVHDYQYTTNENGIPQWDYDYEYYGYDGKNENSQKPDFTYDKYLKYFGKITTMGDADRAYASMPVEIQKSAQKLYQQLVNDPSNKGNLLVTNVNWLPQAIAAYYQNGVSFFSALNLNGKQFQEVYKFLQNKQTVGRASIRKQSFFLQDTWQVNKDTVLAPIIRLDHSSLFGSTVTANMGMTHNLGGNSHRRLKANFGTGYTEPGMGELYYNWEMYSGSAAGLGTGRLGWYWIGNPDLKPEKSVNIDLSVEGENANTYARAGLFYNRIRDYMTTYFTGNLIDFHPEFNENNMQGSWKFLNPPDMIYSFKNIGKAEITGFQASVEQKFGSHWKGKLGYAWLHAVNKSDPDMPRQLLDKPQHKIDIGISYDNVKSGWSGSLWGDYYINMLDSNSVAGNGNYLISYSDPSDPTGNSSIIEYNFAEGGKQTYQKKTFGIWNVMVQKKLDKDSLVYFGVDNLFNHRDYDRALQERVYKMGFNMKFGYDGHKKDEKKKTVVTNAVAEGQGTGVAGKDGKAVVRANGKIVAGSAAAEPRVPRDAFITAPFDVDKKSGVELIGDYQARWNVHGGSDKPSATVTATTHVGDAAKNMLDQKGHGFEQRLRLGFDARIGDNTNITVLGSASGMSGVDTKHDVSDAKGLNHQRLDIVDVTQHADKWDFSIGRLTEAMGVTGYWFGKEYDGGRAVWTSGKNQVRLGYGDFSSSTGITDSAYTHSIYKEFYRAPTAYEFIGLNLNMLSKPAGEVENVTTDNNNVLFYQQLKNAKTVEERAAIISRMYDLAYRAYGNKLYETTAGATNIDIFGSTVQYAGSGNLATRIRPSEVKDLLLNPRQWWDSNQQTMIDGYVQYYRDLIKTNQQRDITSEEEDGVKKAANKALKADGAYEAFYERNYDSANIGAGGEDGDNKVVVNGITNTVFRVLCWGVHTNDDKSSLPRGPLGDVIGAIIKVSGTELQKDTIPAIERAAYIQAKHSFSPDFGVMAWYLRSTGDDKHSFAAAHGDTNDIASFDQLANVFGVGAQWHVGDKATVSLDYGQNRTDFARYMNGHTIYENHEAGNSTFDFGGRAAGGTPHFWVARVDIGKSDTDRPGSWNAFADYKYFQHGSFFGGNGTEGVPDRYLDGIKSFTVGGGYVPAKDILLEAFYTFDAKGIGKRDTLYGSENFSLGDYTRIQMTYRF